MALPMRTAADPPVRRHRMSHSDQQTARSSASAPRQVLIRPRWTPHAVAVRMASGAVQCDHHAAPDACAADARAGVSRW